MDSSNKKIKKIYRKKAINLRALFSHSKACNNNRCKKSKLKQTHSNKISFTTKIKTITKLGVRSKVKAEKKHAKREAFALVNNPCHTDNQTQLSPTVLDPDVISTIPFIEGGNSKEAIKWCREASEEGCVNAMYTMGLYYKKGWGVKKDRTKAAAYFKKAAELGSPYAQFEYANYIRTYAYVNENKATALHYLKSSLQWFKNAAQSGDLRAKTKLALCLYFGIGVEEDRKKSHELLHSCAEQGLAYSQYLLGAFYDPVYNVWDKNNCDAEQAIYWYQKAALQGHTNAYFRLGNIYLSANAPGKNEKKAIPYLKKAASNQHPEAMYKIGECLEKGLGIAKNPHKAIKWYCKADKLNYPKATFNLAKYYQNGTNLKKRP